LHPARTSAAATKAATATPTRPMVLMLSTPLSRSPPILRVDPVGLLASHGVWHAGCPGRRRPPGGTMGRIRRRGEPT
jgi:hypothetical protein